MALSKLLFCENSDMFEILIEQRLQPIVEVCAMLHTFMKMTHLDEPVGHIPIHPLYNFLRAQDYAVASTIQHEQRQRQIVIASTFNAAETKRHVCIQKSPLVESDDCVINCRIVFLHHIAFPRDGVKGFTCNSTCIDAGPGPTRS